MRTIPLVLVLVLAPFTDALTQEPPLQPGQRVRVTVPSLDVNKHEATFERMSGDTLVFSSASYALSDVTRLERHAGRQSHWVRGAIIGFAVGAPVGGALGYAASFDGDFCPYGEPTECVIKGALVAGIPAAALGGLIGALGKTDRWEEVPLDRLRVSVVPTRNGFGIGARIAF